MIKKITALTLVFFAVAHLCAAPTPFESAKLIVDQKTANLDALKPTVAEAIGKFQTTMASLALQREDLKQKIRSAVAELRDAKSTLKQQTETAQNELKNALNVLDKVAASDADKTVASATRVMASSKQSSHSQAMAALNKIESVKQIAD